MLLTSDLHLTSNPADSYRWQVFGDLSRLLKQDPDNHIYILGDLTDRRDRHPSDLVNRLIDTFRSLEATITVISGNHDRPLYAEKPYWSFLSSIESLRFIREPTADGRLLLLPFTDNAKADWDGIDFGLYRAAFCHQSFDGAVMGGGRRYEGMKLDDLMPPHVKVYCGDIHIPQTIGRLTYVGAPHPVKYGDNYRNRILRLNANFDIAEDVTLHPPGKHALDITSVADLKDMIVHRGDAAKVRLRLSVGRLDAWGHEEAGILAWAAERGVQLAGIEPIVETGPRDREAAPEFSDPAEVLVAFAEAEGLDEELLITGLDLLEQAKGTIL